MFSEGSTAVSRFRITPEPTVEQVAMFGYKADKPNGHTVIQPRVFGNESKRITKNDDIKIGFSFLKEDHTVDSTTLKMEVQRQCKEALAMGGLSKSMKVEIKKDVLEQLMQTEENIKRSIIQCFIMNGFLYISTTSETDIHNIEMALFGQNIKIREVNQLAKLYEDELIDIETLALMDLKLSINEIHPEFEAGPDVRALRSFLTWLHYSVQLWDEKPTPLGTVAVMTGGDIELKGESYGATKVIVKSGGHCSEFQTALRCGKLISKLSISFSWEEHDDKGDLVMEQVSLNMDENGKISGIKLPKKANRLLMIHDAIATIDQLFLEYLRETQSTFFQDTIDGMKAWMFTNTIDKRTA